MLKKINEEIKKALLGKDQFRTNALKMIKIVVELNSKVKHPIKDQDIVIGWCKKLERAVDVYPNGSRKDDLLKEIQIVKEFCPKMMTEDEIIQFIKDNVDDVSMKTVMPLLKGKADGRLVKQIIVNWS